jgi:hypothetical protein
VTVPPGSSRNHDHFALCLRGLLDDIGKADTPELPAPVGLFAAALEPGVIGHFERAFQVLAELAAIERIDETGLERHRTRRHRVAAAQLGAVDSHFARRVVDQPLHDVGRLGPAPSRNRADARRIGEYGRDLDIDRRCRMGAGEAAQMHRRRNDAARCQIGADVRDVAGAECQEMPVAVECQLRLADMVAVVVVREHALAVLGDPFDRPPDLARSP